jgi:RES domain-containing protein
VNLRLWRISNFADLSGEGGLVASGRWHSRGRIVHLSDHPASALLEVLVHLEVDVDELPVSHQLLAVDFPDDLRLETIAMDALPPDWRTRMVATRQLGNRWLNAGATALLRVPSAIVPYASNWLLNPSHADAGAEVIAETIRAPFDARLLA